jgi:hypothetical protein
VLTLGGLSWLPSTVRVTHLDNVALSAEVQTNGMLSDGRLGVSRSLCKNQVVHDQQAH